MLNILAAILLFGFIIMFHELGHFLLAKLNGVAVVELSIGMGPRLCSFQGKETRYSLKVLPLGGSCAMADEDTDSGNPNGFLNKPVWSRIAVIAAGPIFNFILALIFGIIIVAYTGYDLPIINNVLEGYPAKEAGLEPGDRILSINGQKMMGYRDLSMFLQLHPDEVLTVKYGRLNAKEREGDAASQAEGLASGDMSLASSWYADRPDYQTFTTTLSAKYNEETQTYMMGIEHMPDYHPARGILHLFQLGWHEVMFQGRAAIESFGLLFRGYVGTEDLGGPVRIVADIGEVVEQVRPAGWLSVILTLMNMGVILSASLGAMNLLPIPALDGGRLVFLLIEAVRGKAIDQEKEGMIHMAGMMLLMGLMLVIMFNDIRNLIFR
ncbi:MAG: site-2 protease family protein [Lachnospiraceae bacterium]|nr:site-2 protease family protein [Lachnospiraceae bacterium]